MDAGSGQNESHVGTVNYRSFVHKQNPGVFGFQSDDFISGYLTNIC